MFITDFSKHSAVASEDEAATVRIIQAIAMMPGCNYSAIAIAAGTSPATVRAVLFTGRLPRREHARRSLVDFAQRNAEARERRQLVFV